MTGRGTTGTADTAGGGADRASGRWWLPPRTARGLRGWGGVGAMAAACALALAATCVLTCAPSGPAAAPASVVGGGAAVARQAADSSCTPGNVADSLRPSAPGAPDGPAVTRIKKAGKLVVGVDQSSYLWGFRNSATGQLQGFDIDLVHAIADDLLGPGGTVVFRAISTKDRFTDLKDHAVDMVVRTVSITCARKEGPDAAAFSTAYFEAGQQMLVPRDRSGVTGYDASIAGKRVCVADNSSAQTLLQQKSFGAKQVVEANQLDCLVDLQLGQADAVFTDDTQAAGLAAQDPAVHLVGTSVNDQPYGVAMNPHDSDLVRRVNGVLESWRSHGWEASYQRWLAKDLPGTHTPPAPSYVD
jgi:polar amino acid transport system substrate-binding protein